MPSIFHAFLGLVGLVCSALLAAGLTSQQQQQSEWTTEPESAVMVSTETPVPGVPMDMADNADESDASSGAYETAPTYSEPAQPVRPPVERPHGKKTVQKRVLRVTAYCDRGITASGVPSGVGQCAAPADVPFGSKIYIPALGKSFTVTYRTHQRFRHNTVDIFMGSRRNVPAGTAWRGPSAG